MNPKKRAKTGGRGKGTPKSGGRRKGTPNRATAAAKAALHAAFAGVGVVQALVAWGKKNPAAFYRLWVRTLPREVKAEHPRPAGTPLPVAAGHAHRLTLTTADLDAVECLGAEVPGSPRPGS